MRYSQTAPWPAELVELVEKTTYREGWEVRLVPDLARDRDAAQEQVIGRGTTLVITTSTVNSYPPHQPMRVNHFFPVPPATFVREDWMRWLLEQFLAVEQHECMEFFTIDGEKPFAPLHGPGQNPYIIRQASSPEQVRTSFRGELNG